MWISVDGVLPKLLDEVLVLSKPRKNSKGVIDIGFLSNEPEEQGWFIDRLDWRIKNVTHWMPLPQPPEEKDNE